MKRFILLSAMVLMVLTAMSQTRGSSSRSQAGSKESEKKEVKSSENTRREPAKATESRSSRNETASPRGNAVNQSSGRRESAATRSGSAANQSSGKRENNSAKPEKTVNQSPGRSATAPGRTGSAVNQSNGKRESTPSRSGNAVNQSSGRRESTPSRSGNVSNQTSGRNASTTVNRSGGTAVNNTHSNTNYVYRHTYPGTVRVREVRTYRHIPAPAPLEIRRVNYVYRAPITVEIYWSNRMYREYRSIYPFYNNWNYTYGSRVLSIPAYDAYYHLGHFRSVYGRVHEVYYAPETDLFYLYFGAPYPYHDFSVVMSRREARKFSNRPEWYFQGQYIMVTGVIAMYDDKPEIEIVRRSQLVRY